MSMLFEVKLLPLLRYMTILCKIMFLQENHYWMRNILPLLLDCQDNAFTNSAK